MDEPRFWDLNDQEYGAVSGLPAGERYNHFVKRVADRQSVWALKDDEGGLVTEGDDEGQVYVAIWPHPRYAQVCAADEWAGAEPTAIEVHEWIETWLPRLAEDGTMTVVFPTPSEKGYIVPPLGMKHDLEEELSLYE